jgi:large subunit ribosomal protein L30
MNARAKKAAQPDVLILRQKGSAIRCTQRQRNTLKGLGLRHLGHVREIEHTPSTYGMFLKVSHIVEILSAKPA